MRLVSEKTKNYFSKIGILLFQIVLGGAAVQYQSSDHRRGGLYPRDGCRTDRVRHGYEESHTAPRKIQISGRSE